MYREKSQYGMQSVVSCKSDYRIPSPIYIDRTSPVRIKPLQKGRKNYTRSLGVFLIYFSELPIRNLCNMRNLRIGRIKIAIFLLTQ